MYGILSAQTSTKIQRTRFPKRLRDEALETLLPTIVPGVNPFDRNIKGVERSPWHIHRGREDTELFNTLADHVKLYCEGSYNLDDRDYLRLTWDDCWIMRGLSEDGFVEPHAHTKHWGGLSFSLYLDLPKGYTTLSFMSVDDIGDAWNRDIIIEEGDMIVFPGNLIHYSKDVSPGRVVMSGNAVVNYHLGEKRGEVTSA